MTRSCKPAALVAAGWLLWAAPAFTQDVETSGAARIRENAAAVAAMMDSDRDGLISKKEFSRHNADQGRFAVLDADGDGVLDEEEQKAANVGPRTLR